MFAAQPADASNPNSDIVVPSVQDVSLSCCKFGPQLSPQLLVAGSWNNTVSPTHLPKTEFKFKQSFIGDLMLVVQVRCWEVNGPTTVTPRAEAKMDGPVLSCCWYTVSGYGQICLQHTLFSSFHSVPFGYLSCVVCFTIWASIFVILIFLFS
jgi:hypothetical protein